MNLLSNFLLRDDGPADEPIQCRLAGQDDVRGGLRLVLGCDDEVQLAEFLRYAPQRHVDVKLLWVATTGTTIVWSALPVISPGKTVLLLSAATGTSGRQREAADTLIRQICQSCRTQGLHLIQTILDPHERTARQIYESCGFSLMAELEYLQTPVRQADPPQLPPGAHWVAYSQANHERFASAILATYEGSLDCPSLNGKREMDDILAGHRATGEFHPDMWFLLEKENRPLGVLLLSVTPQSDALELVYLGLPRSARGTGTADLLMRQALWAVNQSRRSRITLAVDARNAPALKLYYRHGMQRICGKVAMMKDLRQP